MRDVQTSNPRKLYTVVDAPDTLLRMIATYERTITRRVEIFFITGQTWLKNCSKFVRTRREHDDHGVDLLKYLERKRMIFKHMKSLAVKLDLSPKFTYQIIK